MKLNAMLRQTRESHDTPTSTLKSNEITVEAPSFDEAIALVEEQTPAGWQRIWVRTA